MRKTIVAGLGSGLLLLAACSSSMTLDSFVRGTWECTAILWLGRDLPQDEYQQLREEDPEQWKAATTMTSDEVEQWFEEFGVFRVQIDEGTWGVDFLPADTPEMLSFAEEIEPKGGLWAITAEGIEFSDSETNREDDVPDDVVMYEILGVPQESPDQFAGPVDLIQENTVYWSNAGENTVEVSWSGDILNLVSHEEPSIAACRKA